jgi:hypothetical protein
MDGGVSKSRDRGTGRGHYIHYISSGAGRDGGVSKNRDGGHYISSSMERMGTSLKVVIGAQRPLYKQ